MHLPIITTPFISTFLSQSNKPFFMVCKSNTELCVSDICKIVLVRPDGSYDLNRSRHVQCTAISNQWFDGLFWRSNCVLFFKD